MRPGLFLSVAVIGAAGAVAIVSCADDSQSTGSTDPCPQGICGQTSSSGNGGAGTGGSGTTTSATGTGGGSGCVDAWLCTPWETNGTDDNGTRKCTDLNSCGTTNGKPAESATLPALDFDYYKCNVEHTDKEWRKNFDAARGFGLDAQGNAIPSGNVDSSELIAQPIVGGKAHAVIKLFKSGDSEHTTLKA